MLQFCGAKINALVARATGLEKLVAHLNMENAKLRQRHALAQRLVSAQMLTPEIRSVMLGSPGLSTAAMHVVQDLPALGREPTANLHSRPYLSDSQALGAQQAVGATPMPLWCLCVTQI